jgi:hypothetical protein
MKSLSTINIQAIISTLRSDRKKLVSTIAWILLGYFILRGCVFNSGNSLPAELTEKIQNRYVGCISPEVSPIRPGDTRQPECGTVDIQVIGQGIVPQEQKSEGITRAICFQIKVENPFVSTEGQGTTRHEVKWSAARTSDQVAVLQNGSWKIFPDQAQENEQRWKAYSCPTPTP